MERAIRFLTIAILALGSLSSDMRAGTPEAAAAAAVIPDSLVIRVYDNAGVATTERSLAMSRADGILSRADIDVEWIDCPARRFGRPSSACNMPPGRTELVVRLMNGPASNDYAHKSEALGYSLIDTTTGTGTMATLFIDRVTRLAEVARMERATVLGRAIAHEIGHLILGSNEHSDTGIMREIWTPQQLTSGRPQDWMFHPDQSERLRQARLLTESGTSTATTVKRGKPAGG